MLKIAAAFHHRAALGEAPSDLRTLLQAMTGQNLRRINRYLELALYGALHCGRTAGGVAPDTALYLASEAPMLVDCVRALRGVVSEQRPPTPFEFMNISGNMAGFYIAQHLKMLGPQLALHRRGAGFECALELLQLSSGAHRHALLGYVEEGVWPLAEQRLRLALTPDRVLVECSHWLYLDADCAQPLALIEVVPDAHSLDELMLRLRTVATGAILVESIGEDTAPWRQLGWAQQRALRVDTAYGTGETAAMAASYALAPEPRPLWYLQQVAPERWSLLRLFRPGPSTSA